MSLLEPIIFEDITPIEVPVTYGAKSYILKEAGEGAACRFRDAVLRAHRLKDGKLTGMEGIPHVEPLLVSMCLYERVNGAKGQQSHDVLVSLATINTWKPQFVSKLFKRAKEISGLNEDVEDPTRKALQKALKLDGAPVTWEQLTEWAGTLPDDDPDLSPLRDFFKPSQEELVKNALDAGPAISA
jgi:hypothetical protein